MYAFRHVLAQDDSSLYLTVVVADGLGMKIHVERAAARVRPLRFAQMHFAAVQHLLYNGRYRAAAGFGRGKLCDVAANARSLAHLRPQLIAGVIQKSLVDIYNDTLPIDQRRRDRQCVKDVTGRKKEEIAIFRSASTPPGRTRTAKLDHP